VVAEIPGGSRKEEIVLVGAHLDSWDLGGGALDNGANVAMLIDLARQLKRLGLQPARTLRFALWNGEEQGMVGSQGYTQRHASELDRHVFAQSYDIGCGRLLGFFTGARPELLPAMRAALAPVAGRGPFELSDVPIVGTDNFDFMLHGVANVVGNHAPAEYGPNYHARSDELERCDGSELRRNAGIVAALSWGIADGEVTWQRQTRADIEAIMARTDLATQMKTFNVWDEWAAGTRGRPKP
jgi:Zn-dependent M28 family amino/carboxypeptidase